MRKPKADRLCDVVMFKASHSQRRFLEEMAKANEVTLAEFARSLVDIAMEVAEE